MPHDHPSLQDLEGFLRDASPPGKAARNRRVVRHLLAECAICRDRLRAIGWGGGRIDNLLLRTASRAGWEGDDAQTTRGAVYDYDQAFAQTHRFIAELLDGTTPASAQRRPPGIAASLTVPAHAS